MAPSDDADCMTASHSKVTIKDVLAPFLDRLEVLPTCQAEK